MVSRFWCFVCAIQIVVVQQQPKWRHVEGAVTTTQQQQQQDSYDSSPSCIPRQRDYNNSSHIGTQPSNSIAPELFRVQFTITTTTSTATNKQQQQQQYTKTTTSTFVVQFNRTWSPLGVDRMYQLIQDQYFDCAVFFRVVPSYVSFA
jgi:hypothetical protein